MKWIFCFLIATAILMTTQDVFATTGGVYNDPVTVGGSVSIDEDSPSLLQIPISASMNIESYNVPDMSLPARLFFGAKPFLLTHEQQQKSVPSENNLFISGSTRLCKTSGTLQTTSGDFYKTQPIPKLSQLDEGLQSLQFLGHDTLAPDKDGMYNFKREPLELSELPDCNTVNTGFPQTSQKVDIAKRFSLSGFVEALKSLFSGKTAQADATVKSKQLWPYANEMNTASMHIAKTYLPSTINASKGKDHGDVENELVSGQTVKTRMEHSAAIEEYANTVLCSLVPSAKREAVGLSNENCKKNFQESTSCGTALPDMTISEAACKLKNIDKINLYAEVKLSQDYVPPTMVAIVEKAADTYKVPASSILAVMGHEQGFNRKEIVWNEENVKNWSLCGQKMPFCDDTIGGTAQAPYGFFATWFYKDAGVGTLWDAVTKVDPSRTKENISLCNFMDVTFAVAKTLSIDAAFRPPKDVTMKTCFGLPMTNTRRPTSCSRSEWTNPVILQSHVSYGGYCPETNREYPYKIAPFFKDVIFKFTKNM